MQSGRLNLLQMYYIPITSYSDNINKETQFFAVSLLVLSHAKIMEINRQNIPAKMSLTIFLKAVCFPCVFKGTAPVIASKLIFVDIATVVCCPKDVLFDLTSYLKIPTMPGSLQSILDSLKFGVAPLAKLVQIILTLRLILQLEAVHHAVCISPYTPLSPRV